MKSFLSSVYLSLGYLFVVGQVFAQDSGVPLLAAPSGSVSTDVSVQSVPQLIINILFTVAIVLAVIYLMYGGIRWITSGGDKGAVESAKKHILSAVIGIVVVAGTFFMLNVIFNVLGAENPLNKGFTLPTLKPNP